MELSLNHDMMEVGIDEAGRGCLFGRVYAAAVLWGNEPLDTFEEELRSINCHQLASWDSKKISREKRNNLYDFICRHAMDYGVGYAEAHEIDTLNIYNATMLAMHRALDAIHLPIDRILVDGPSFKPYMKEDVNNTSWIPYTCVNQGDGKYLPIGAASILAKVSHDNYIHNLYNLDEALHVYCLNENQGYGTKKHMDALKIHGPSAFHRLSFKPCMQNV